MAAGGGDGMLGASACAQFRNAVFGQILFTADTLAELDKYDERDWGKSSMKSP